MRSLAVVALLFATSSCAHGTTVQKLNDDSYRVTCADLPLDRCLAETASNTCDKRAYFVARGISDVNLRGRTDAPDVAASSEAVIRCAPTRSWGEDAKKLMSGAPDAAAVANAPSICAPGSTQACVGGGACQGGQACKPDGSGYEPCDCKAPTSPANAPAISPPPPEL